ncbi:oxidoreductase [Gordonia soli]|uniref:Putative oxidoreductase n=1 Tax=Gordonia soli NBRC 108243 TaxID=1223545 RepID=M0QLQ5_9ACTN|nr:oxidoreductase [Gordonia soli]GAC69493.1 putative oxidoreductase [Gordonia soli NBRC 108243]
MGEVWLITGTSAGFGRAIAEVAAERGHTVVATARNPSSLTGFDTALALDVGDQASIDAAVEATLSRHGQIDVLVNNAGFGLIGAVEELSDTDLRDVLDTNVFGVLRTTRAVLPHMRARRSGHIVAMSSVGGVVGNPGHAAYATSKFALEGLSEALAGEVAPWNIGVTLVEPGPFRTDFAGRSIRHADPIADYADSPAGALRARFGEQDGKQPNDPRRAAEIIVDVLAEPEPPLRLPLGPEAIERIRTKLASQRTELDAYAERAADTRYR